MRSFYRFPEMHIVRYDDVSSHDQIMHVFSEVEEAYAELVKLESARLDGRRKRSASLARAAYGAELMDVIHAAETALRIEFAEDEVNSLREKVIEKNADRGYYSRAM